MKLLKNVTFTLGLLTVFGGQYAADMEVEPTPMEVVEASAATATAEQIYKLKCAGQEFVVSKAFVESCQTLKDCTELSDEGDAIPVAVAKPEALDQLIEIYEDTRLHPEASSHEKIAKLCAARVAALEPKQFFDLIEVADYLNLTPHLHTMLDKAHREFTGLTTKIQKAQYIKKLPQQVALEVLARLAKYRTLLTLDGHTDSVYSASWSPDGSKIVTASSDNTAKIWNALTGALLQTLNGHTKSVFSASWSPDGSRIVTASSDQTAKIWNALTAALLQTIDGHTGGVWSASWSPDGSRIITAFDKTANIWNALTGALLQTLDGDTEYVSSANWSLDGSKIVTAFYDRTVKIWKVETPKEILEKYE